jgi:transposase
LWQVKCIKQQAVMLNQRGREWLVKQRTMLANAIRAHFAEFGIITAQGTQNLCKLKTAAEQAALPKNAMDVLDLAFDQLDALNKSIKALEMRIHAWHKSNKTSLRLASIPGVGPLTACAIVACVGVVGAHATRTFLWRQTNVGRDFQTRRWLYPQAIGAWRTRRGAYAKSEIRRANALA